MSLELWRRKRKNTLDRLGIGQFCRPPVAGIHQCVCVCVCVRANRRPAKQVARPLVNQNNNNLFRCGASAAKTRLELGYGNRIIRAVHPPHVAHPAADKSTFQSINRRPVFTHARRGCCNVLNCAFHTPPCMPCPVPGQIGSAPKIRDQPMDNSSHLPQIYPNSMPCLETMLIQRTGSSESSTTKCHTRFLRPLFFYFL
jgi:hypothetical protein